MDFIKEKRCRKIKGRMCTDGRPHMCYIPKEYASFPTIYLGSLFTGLITNAHEGRYVTIFDFPGSYLKSDMPK